MYKVFFKDRIIFLAENIKAVIRNNEGLFCKYQNKIQLGELINAFNSFSNIRILFICHDDPDLLRNEFFSYFKFIRASGGLVYNINKDEVLFIKRSGIWDLPKGKSEKEEDNQKTALREVSEETGLKSLILEKSIIKTYHTYNIGEIPVLKETEWFKMRTDRSEKTKPQVKENITEVRWINKSDIPKILDNTYLSIIDVLKAAGLID